MQNPEFYNFIVLPVIIFVCRIGDVSLGTLRIMYVSKGYKALSALTGFFEVIIWIFAIGQVINNLESPIHILAYACGYTSGNYIGVWIEEKLSVGNLMLRVFIKDNSHTLINILKEKGYRLTKLKGDGIYGSVDIVFTIIRRKDQKKVTAIIKSCNPDAFYSVEDVRSVENHDECNYGVQAGIDFVSKLRTLFIGRSKRREAV